ncbi:hypothetical protein [Planomonospora venezuelensis]|uniref:Uncharacterized protein n=1 Tax=Planomonospora venezuelensis TaxID=1999 RepID=A0A841DBF4_PLAVE|nr:hypothetical protein [Planomonospora venezuelensis]MBB5966153.1 hypothetical protein [Planomonospora venezuelensis]GIN05486.1 hypothetical protein Pve01_71440 [Planomonospora venezuelensis]
MIRHLLSLVRPAPRHRPSSPAARHTRVPEPRPQPVRLSVVPMPGEPAACAETAISRKEELALLRVEILYGISIDRRAYLQQKAQEAEVLRRLRERGALAPSAMAAELENALERARAECSPRQYTALQAEAAPVLARLLGRRHLRVITTR